VDATSSIEPDPRRYGIVALYRELWRLALGHRGKILLAFGLLLGSQLFRLAVPWLTAQAIDAVQRSGLDGVGTAGRWLLAGFLATSASWLLHGPGRVLERNVALAARRRLSGELVGKLFSLPLAWHDRHHSGETVQRLRQCTGALYDFAQSQFIYLQNAARLVGPVIALCLIDLRVGVLALVGYLLIAVVIIGFDRRMILLAHRENAAERRHSATQLDAFGSIGTVNALRMGKGLARLIDERLVAIFEPLRRSIILNEWKWCSVDLLASGLAIGLVAAYAAILVASGGSGGGDADAVPGLPIGRLFMVYEYSAQAGGVITALGAHLQGFARQRADFAAGDVIRNASVEAGSGVAGAGRPADASGSQHWRELRIDGLRFAHPAGAELEVDGLRLVRGRRYALVGPSGSGKSTLVIDTLYRALAQKLYHGKERPGKFTSIEGLEHVDKVIDIDQSPIGRTPRSNPATYTGVFSFIRELFSGTAEAKVRGYKAGRFSFNVKGGRCEACAGDGIIKIEMHFLPDVYVPCDVCKGKRYNRETLEVLYKGRNIAEVLALTVAEALELFVHIPRIREKLQTLCDVGLGYITLGQSATTLSGGEAQRIKLSRELSKRSTGRTLYLLDEPTTGLHFADVQRLLDVLIRLRETGNTIIIIEHNLEVIKTADWVIDLGPEGGEHGGNIVAAGTPEAVSRTSCSHTGQYLKQVLERGNSSRIEKAQPNKR